MLVGKKQKTKKGKSKPKKQRTFTSSEFSLPDEHLRLSTDPSRTQPRRRQPPPQPQPAHPPRKNRSVKQLQSTTKKRGKSRSRLDKCETYEVIPYKNSLNSEIVFSNQQTRREGDLQESKGSELAIPLNHQYLVDNNRLLRISIRKEYLRKVEAAVKIQKVFRGYLTRKVLQNCLQKEQDALQNRLQQIRSQPVSEHSSYFADRELMTGSLPQPRRRMDQAVFEYSQGQPQEDDEQEADAVVYRHHEPIYSQDEISGYLESSQEEDFDRDAFDNHIIFETNEEYIDSRKSSQQPQPRNKLSRPAEPIIEEPLDSPLDPNLTKTEKKQERIKASIEDLQVEPREDTIRITEDIKERYNIQEGEERQDSPRTSTHPTFAEGEATLNMREGEGECLSVQRFKQQEVQRWDEVISLVQSQMGKPECVEISNFMQQLMELSLKNKRSLQSGSRPSSPGGLSHRQDSRGKLKTLRAQRQYLALEEQKTEMKDLSEKGLSLQYGGESQQHSNATPHPFISPNSLDNTAQLKRFLQDNIQDNHIEEMLKLREDLMRKREAEEIRKLNLQLQQGTIQQQDYIQQLQAINHKYDEEKASINRSRQDISRGHQAALRLTRQAVTDAKRLGYDLPVSRSLEGLRYKSPLLVADIVVDEMAARNEERPRQMRSPLADMREPSEPIDVEGVSEESSDLEFTEEELRRFRRAQPYDIELAEIADLGRNVMISEELLRQQQAQENQLMMTQHVSREIYEIEEASPPRSLPLLDPLCEWLFSAIAWQAAGQLMLRPVFAQRLLQRGQLVRPQPVADQDRLQFLSLLQQHFPTVQVLNSKLNQKICPLPGELLRCMRIDFSQQDDDDNSYEEIGKYEFIIGQEVCNEAIREFRALVDRKAPSIVSVPEEVERVGRDFGLGERVVRYVQQREKYLANRRNHTKELRWEVLNIEVHCLFDAWNEELIFLRSQKAGYSGIGLNQLTLSVHDHNWHVPIDKTLPLLAEGKQRLLRTLALSSPGLLFPLSVEQDEDELLEVDSRWIFYADEALSYGLELVYLIQEDLFNQCAKELRKRMLF